MAVIQTGGNVSGVANVDDGFNLNVTTPLDPNLMGGVKMFTLRDAGVATGNAEINSPTVDDKARMLALVKKLIRKPKVKSPVIKQRERIDEFRMDSSDFNYTQKPLKVNQKIRLLSQM